MNDESRTAVIDSETDGPADEVLRWIGSDEGRSALTAALEEAKRGTSLLEDDYRVRRESLHEPVTV